jgi:acyl-CoA dehydrogenase
VDFDDTPSEAAFRDEVRGWLKANASPREMKDTPSALLTSSSADDLPEARRIQNALCEAKLTGITWPAAYGGRGGTVVDELIFHQEAARYHLPLEIFGVGIGLAGPTLIAHGTPEQQQRFLPPLLSGDEVWCQLFSEPGAGSDLAGMRTRAVRDGDEWVVSGQKVWNSGAHYSDWGILPVRTDPSLPKHKGITYFVVDMHTPGITIRPLHQISGHSHFCEVFLDEVRIPASQLLGGLNAGWGVTQTTLMSERVMIGTDGADQAPLIALARRSVRNGRPASEDLGIRQRLADIYIRSELLRFLQYRTLTALGTGAPPGPEGSIGKLSIGQLIRRVGDLALDLQGPHGTLQDASAPSAGAWQEAFLTAPMLRIAGGTDEIQRNILGERVLGLPREPDPWRTQAFADMQAATDTLAGSSR